MDFQGIRSAAQLSTVGYSFLILDMNEFFTKQKISICIFIACSSMKGSQCRKNFVSDKHIKTGFTSYICVSCAFADGAYRIILDAGYTLIILPLVLVPWFYSIYLDKQIPLGRLVGGVRSSLQTNCKVTEYNASLWFLRRMKMYCSEIKER